MNRRKIASTLFVSAILFVPCLPAYDTHTTNETVSPAYQNALVSLIPLPKVNVLAKDSVLELIVRRISKESKKKYIYEVSVMSSEKNTANVSHESTQYLGSFSYFSPEPSGGSSTFIVPLGIATNRISELIQNQQYLKIKIEAIGFDQEPAPLNIELIQATILTGQERTK